VHRWGGSSTIQAGNVVLTTSISEIVCRTPCDTEIDGRNGQEFFFAGKGITPSGRFQIFERSGDLNAVVKPGSASAFTGGFLALGLGAGVATAGAALTFIGTRQHPEDKVTTGPHGLETHTMVDVDTFPALKIV